VKQTDNSSLELQHAEQPSLSAIAPGEVILGTVMDIDSHGQCLVDYHANPHKTPLVAVTTQAISKKHIGRQVALLFANGDPQQPVIMGLIHSPLQEMLETFEVTPTHNEIPLDEQQNNPVVDDVTIDGKRIVLEGQEEIVLRCGEASITLTKAGKILIRGKYLLNRSTGVNRIMGGSVQVN
jgi:hypothetical protein